MSRYISSSRDLCGIPRVEIGLILDENQSLCDVVVVEWPHIPEGFLDNEA